MGSSATSLSTMLGEMVDISPPTADLVSLVDEIDEGKVGSFYNNSFVKVLFKMEIGELVNSSIMQLYPIDLAKDLYTKFISSQEPEQAAPAAAPQAPPAASPVQPAASQAPPQMGQPMMNQMPPQMGQPMMGQMPPQMGQPMPYNYVPVQDVNVQPVQFQPFNTAVNPITQQENMDLIMDVPLEVTVELGRTSKSIKEILEFAPGTIIELDKLAGEPINVLVNGKLVAKGEVVVIEESFGVRITDIIKE